jgi:hypothetical protein
MKHHMTKTSLLMPIWVASPPTQKERRNRTIILLDDTQEREREREGVVTATVTASTKTTTMTKKST